MSAPPTKPDDALSPRQRWLDPLALTQLGALKVRARRVVEGVLAGLHRSPHKGSSVEFAEYKEYAPGDPIRHIDWKAFGKSDKYYVKQYEDETNLRAWILLDASGSMAFGGDDTPTKLDYARTLAASLAHLLLGQGDAAGLVLFDEGATRWVPPSGRSNHLDDILEVLESVRPAERPTDLASAIESLAERPNRRSLVIVISDMLDASPKVPTMLRVLRSRRQDTAAFHILDPLELSLPYEGLTLFEGLESDGELLVDPDDIRDAYLETFGAHLEHIETAFLQAQADYYKTTTDQPFEAALLRMLQARASKRGRRRGGR